MPLLLVPDTPEPAPVFIPVSAPAVLLTTPRTASEVPLVKYPPAPFELLPCTPTPLWEVPDTPMPFGLSLVPSTPPLYEACARPTTPFQLVLSPCTPSLLTLRLFTP